MQKPVVYIGPSGWSYPDWRGVVYPTKAPHGFSELAFMAKYFNAVEVNSTFYRIPQPSSVQHWLDLVKGRSGFVFCVKLWRQFTHSENPLNQADVQSFRRLLELLAAQERLGALLIQFPWRFKKSKETLHRVTALAEHFNEFPCAVEFRHASWQDKSVFEQLAQRRLAFVNIDQPVIGDSVKPSNVVTSNIGYIRFHGRNSTAWFAEDAGRDARYNYLYEKSEILSWLQPIKDMSAEADKTFIFFNNHFRGQALVNAFQLMYEMSKEKPMAPEALLRHFPDAVSFAKADLRGQTLELF